MNKNIESILGQLVEKIAQQSEKYLDHIIQESVRVENYFTVLMLRELKEMEAQNNINGLIFQKHIPGRNRKHIDFYFEIEGRKVYMEVKHVAIDTEKKRNRRTLEFYTGDSVSQKKVGLLGDMDKLSELRNEKTTQGIVFAVVTNPPSEDVINERIKHMRTKKGIIEGDYGDWNIIFNRAQRTPSSKLGFLIANKPN
jgi:hypothetical protein